MTDSVRKRIRDGYRALLIEHVPEVSGRVYAQRTQRLGNENTPALSVYFGDANERPITASYPRIIETTIEIAVCAYAQANPNDIEDILEGLRSSVDLALAKNPRLDGLVKDLAPSRTRLPDPLDRESPQGILVRYLTATFHAVENRPNEHR